MTSASNAHLRGRAGLAALLLAGCATGGVRICVDY